MLQNKICDIQMTGRLFNILSNNKILCLSEISNYSYNEIMNFRNMGIKTMQELENICEMYHIPVQKQQKIAKELKDGELPKIFLIGCTEKNIENLWDLQGKTALYLFELCNKEYLATMDSYYILQKRGLTFTSWGDAFVFEFIDRTYSRRLWEWAQIKKMSQLVELDCKEISSIRGIGQTSAAQISRIVQDYKYSAAADNQWVEKDYNGFS